MSKPKKPKAKGKPARATQYAALCYRLKGDKPQFLLITSRNSKRWIIPKGWPMAGKTPAQTAKTEAWEEAGVRGSALKTCVGSFDYTKDMGPDRGVKCRAMVYPVRVKSLAETYPEKGQRRRKWMGRKKAMAKISDHDMIEVFRTFDPHKL